MRINICGIKIDSIDMAQAIAIVDQLVIEKQKSFLVTPNVDHIVSMQSDNEFWAIANKAVLVLPDGMPIIWAARWLGTPFKEKISGSDLFPKICKLAAEKNYKVYFLGGRDGAAAKSAHILKIKYPGLQVVGTYCPSLGFEKDDIENQKIINMIKKTKPDILFVGLGAPKQEKWIYKYKNQYQVPLSIGIGVSFEFISGIVKRAPKWMQDVGLEWFWRLMMEPVRLWKRYLIDDPIFFWLIFKQKMGWLKVD